MAIATDRAASTATPAARALVGCAIALGIVSGCLSSRFANPDPPPDLDAPTRRLIEQITGLRQAHDLAAPNLVAELRTPAVKAALLVARGDDSLKTAAHRAATQAVAAFGRHVWTFAADCTDMTKFQPPALAVESKILLLGAAAVPAAGGHTMVVLVIAEPSVSSLRADQMGGGPGGTNPSPEIYAHPSAATGSCGEHWPPIQHPPL